MTGVFPSPLEILWETRGHNRALADWVIIKLGVPSGKVYGFEIDTACFNENHGPAVTAEGTFLDGSHLDANTPVRIARFRSLGTTVPVFPSDPDAIIDLAHVSFGGLEISYRDRNFETKAANLLLPGRGKDPEPGHVDWVAVKVVIVDILLFCGNYSQAVEIYTINSSDQHIASDASGWELIVPAHSCEADKEHAFQSPSSRTLTEKRLLILKWPSFLTEG
ncbi:unnamed protein product [Tuber aestivum]|uniref:Allantoicase domain-containing protein n=1 Tax=Tuber aestivum TaxID=59557 RepID=A0A292PIX3_9PEZI|nr:unnamed protein product [Tuber aestivum]